METIKKPFQNWRTTVAAALIAIGEFGESNLPPKFALAAKILGFIGLALHTKDA
jgi:hypothetical protein